MPKAAASAALLLAAWLLAACDTPPPAPAAGTNEHNDEAHYLGSTHCANCHAHQYRAWQGSHHARALQDAKPATVLGVFDGQSAFGVRFERRAGTFEVIDDGERFPVLFTIGVTPLQQYLLDTGNGRLQALDVAWDVSRGEWFALNEPRPQPGDILHWRGRGFNWNNACADCHSTGIEKRFDAGNSSYATRWIEQAVGCEACHGPGSEHVKAPNAPYSRHLATAAQQVEACAACHSRRTRIAEGHPAGAPLLDAYLPVLPVPPQYQADGQIDDEVFEYGSFVQSRMYRAGVTCSDCHEPHTGRLHASGDGLCLRCHSEAPPARFPMLTGKRYDTPEHHFHPPAASGARCAACHMPARFYMVIDERRDHSLRVPNPWLAAREGLRDACTDCHRDREALWAARELEARGVHERTGDLGALLVALAKGRREAEAEAQRRAADPHAAPLVRATLLTGEDRYESGLSFSSLLAGLGDEAAEVRHAAASSARIVASSDWRRLAPLLADPVRAVRRAAALSLLPRRAQLRAAERGRFERVLGEYVAFLKANADLPDAHAELASIERQLGDLEGAEASLERALAIEPHWIPALINLADLQRATGRDTLAGQVLRDAVRAAPESAEAHFALGLWYVRADRDPEALEHLVRAVELAPDRPRFAYALALGQAESGDLRGAIATLERSAATSGKSREIALALATYYRDAGELAAARREAETLVRRFPSDAAARAMLRALTTTEPEAPGADVGSAATIP